MDQREKALNCHYCQPIRALHLVPELAEQIGGVSSWLRGSISNGNLVYQTDSVREETHEHRTLEHGIIKPKHRMLSYSSVL